MEETVPVGLPIGAKFTASRNKKVEVASPLYTSNQPANVRQSLIYFVIRPLSVDPNFPLPPLDNTSRC